RHHRRGARGLAHRQGARGGEAPEAGGADAAVLPLRRGPSQERPISVCSSALSHSIGPFFGELYLRSTRPFLPDDVTRAEGDYLTRAFNRVEVPGPLADIGCGHGRHLKELRTERLVVGVDFDPLSLSEARQVRPV